MAVRAFDAKKVEAAVYDLLQAIGENPDREGLKDTPKRVANFYREWLNGQPAYATTFQANYDEMVVVKDIPFYSLCEHHLLPFFGKAHVGYIPNGRVIGLSKIVRLVQQHAHKPQIQEQLTVQIADDLMKKLNPRGVMVLMEAEHLCISMRGARTPGNHTLTSAIRGSFRDEARGSRKEFLALVKGNGA